MDAPDTTESGPDAPITTGSLMRWIYVAGILVTVVLAYAGLKADAGILAEKTNENTRQISEIREQISKQLEEQKKATEQNTQAIIQLQRQGDVMVTIVKRIDKHLGGEQQNQ